MRRRGWVLEMLELAFQTEREGMLVGDLGRERGRTLEVVRATKQPRMALSIWSSCCSSRHSTSSISFSRSSSPKYPPCLMNSSTHL
jgi:hypothetical protein